jgi:hypothetical protein
MKYWGAVNANREGPRTTSRHLLANWEAHKPKLSIPEQLQRITLLGRSGYRIMNHKSFGFHLPFEISDIYHNFP